jgi:cyclin C
MDSQLIVHHPYRDLQELQSTLGLTQEEISLAWSIVNDHYLTDLPLLHTPHVIAITAAFLAVVLKPGQGGQLQAQNVRSPSIIIAWINGAQVLLMLQKSCRSFSGPLSMF